MKYKFVIFDVDGTLMDSETVGVMALQRTIKKLMGLDLSYEEALPFFGLSSKDTAVILHYDDDEGLAKSWMADFKALAVEKLDFFPGVLDLIRKIKASGAMVGIVTSRSESEVAADPRVKNLFDNCDASVCSDDTSRRKPDPEPVLCAISRATALCPNLQPSDCIYCGDTEYDCLAGKGAGCSFALADWKKRGRGNIAADFVFISADECWKILN